jgi:uncharacterized protein (DUF2141 family)
MEACMYRKLFFLCVSFFAAGSLFAGNIRTTIEINRVIVNGGLVYVAVYSNENEYKTEITSIKFILEPVSSIITHTLELPEGEYVVSVFQDSNNDGELNTGIFGMPSEPVGKTNYNLRGAPGGFNKLKAPVNRNSTKLIVNMGKVRLLG